MTAWQVVTATGFVFACVGFLALCVKTAGFFNQLYDMLAKLVEGHRETMTVLNQIKDRMPPGQHRSFGD